jgi:hypothetical protein
MIVTFFDADGDQFPVRVWGEWDSSDPLLLSRARRKLDEYVRDGICSPRSPLKVQVLVEGEDRS